MAHKNRIRVQHIRNCRGITTLTGPETYLLDLARNIDQSLVDLSIAVVINRKNRNNLFLDHLRTTDAKVDAIPTRSPFDFSDLNFLKHTLSHRKPDLLITHDARSDVMAWRVGNRGHVPWLAFAHGWVNWEYKFSKSWLYAQLEMLAVRKASVALVASEHMSRNLSHLGNAPDRIRHIPIGIDVDRFGTPANGSRVRRELDIAPDALVVGLVGRLHPWKGQLILVRAAAEVLRTHPDTFFLLIGDSAFPKHDHYRDSIETLIQNMGISDQVQLTGTREDIPDVMSALDVCVVPSMHEPYGLVAIEAQAASVPVIASNVGGLPEIVVDGITGCLVPSGDNTKLASAIINLLNDKKMRLMMGQAGRVNAVEHFSIRAMTRKTESLYSELSSIEE